METKQSIYDEICRVLTDWETQEAVDDDLYNTLVKVQRYWETIITAQTEQKRDTTFLNDYTTIVTQNTDGQLYIITEKYIQDIIDDWEGKCDFVPENDARVFFFSWNNNPINPHNYTDFESVINILKNIQKGTS